MSNAWVAPSLMKPILIGSPVALFVGPRRSAVVFALCDVVVVSFADLPSLDPHALSAKANTVATTAVALTPRRTVRRLPATLVMYPSEWMVLVVSSVDLPDGACHAEFPRALPCAPQA